METQELLDLLERGEREREPVEVAGFRFTSLDRILWPGQRLTKGDLARYYVRVADVMLRYVEGRPLMLRRFHDGIDEPPFVQQRVSRPVPDGVRSAKVPVAEGEPTERYIGARGTILYAAQMNAVELHCWQSRVEEPNRPDWVILDLDPSPGAGFRKVVQVALALRERIEAFGLNVLVKVSGSRGLHLYVPTAGEVDYVVAAEFARRVAESVAADEPKLATVERVVDRRGYRVYIDHLQNARGKTAVAPYSPRARPGAPVAVPLHWDEVDDRLKPRAFRLDDVPARLEREGDPWADALVQTEGGLQRELERLARADEEKEVGEERKVAD